MQVSAGLWGGGFDDEDDRRSMRKKLLEGRSRADSLSSSCLHTGKEGHGPSVFKYAHFMERNEETV